MMKRNEVNRQPGFHVHKTKPRTIELAANYYWIFIAKNGRTISKSSEVYDSKQAAVKSIKIMLKLLQATELCLYYDHTKKGSEKVADLFVF